MISPKADKYIETLQDGNRRNPLYYEARAFLDKMICRFLEMKIGDVAKIQPIHTGDRGFNYVRRNGNKVLKLSYSEGIWILKHILYGAPLTEDGWEAQPNAS